MTKPPNILWYTADQMRFDTIGALGNDAIRTPALDRLVSRGTAFRRTYVQNPVCTPSRASMLTGRYPASHRVYRNGIARFPDDEVLVTRMLADAGYDCGLVGKLHLSTATKQERRPDDGYRVFNWSHNPRKESVPGTNAYHTWLRSEKGIDPTELYGDDPGFCKPAGRGELSQVAWCTEMAKRFISERRNGPWMLSINPYDPHPPFDPPSEYLDRVDPDRIPPPLFRESDIERQEEFARVRSQMVKAANPNAAAGSGGASEDFGDDTGSIPPSEFNGREVKAAYYAMIEQIDDHFGRLVDFLEGVGELENTLIIFTSDHGELLGDHGLLYKGCRFFEGLVHVPLVISWPARLDKGRQTDALVELIDLAPTLLDAVGLETPYFVQGRSLWDLLTGEADLSHHKEIVISDFNDSVGTSPVDDATQATMTFDGRYKLVVYHTHELAELFDLEDDPGEFVNLWHVAGTEELRSRLLFRHLNALMGTIAPGIRRVDHA